ncbi:MAG: FUN14 domain-containing protein [Candidatus Bathyarchaeaceae archaeon]
MSEAFAPILFQLGMGGIGGFFIGYTIRKAIKIALIFGIVIFSLLFLIYAKVIGINYGELVNAVSSFFEAVNPLLGSLTPLLVHLPLIGGLIIGLIVGYRMG